MTYKPVDNKVVSKGGSKVELARGVAVAHTTANVLSILIEAERKRTTEQDNTRRQLMKSFDMLILATCVQRLFY